MNHTAKRVKEQILVLKKLKQHFELASHPESRDTLSPTVISLSINIVVVKLVGEMLYYG